MIADAHGSCLDATPAALALFGVDIATLRMLRVGDLSLPDSPDSLTTRLLASCDTVGQWLPGTCNVLPAAGSPLPVRFATLRMKRGSLAVRFEPIDHDASEPQEPRDVLQLWREQERAVAWLTAGSFDQRIAELEALWLAAEYQRLAIARARAMDREG